MSLTGVSIGRDVLPVRLVAERIELMALLWTVLDGDAAYSANPRLQMIARAVPELGDLPATMLLQAARASASRDAIVKGLVGHAHGLATPPAIGLLAEALDPLSDRWDALLEGLAAPLSAAYARMRESADPLAAGFDPAADLTAITGERDAFELVVLPSLFLPPPQNGRHSVLVERQDHGAAGYLHYGFPLDDDPARFGISRYWLLGGAWHYPAQRFLARHWPSLAADLRAMPELSAALSGALARHRVRVAWPEVIVEHLAIALKCALCARAGLPETVHRSFARTQGLALFDWFRAWIGERARDPAGFIAALHRLPRELADAQEALIAAAAAMSSGPESINYALASRDQRPAIVLPDDWDDALEARIARRWARVTPTVLRERGWRAAAAAPATIIAFGEIGYDPLVDDLLARHDMSFPRTEAGGDVLIALFASDRARDPWQIAVAVHDRQVAGEFAAEHAMSLFHRTARFSALRFVEGDGITG